MNMIALATAEKMDAQTTNNNMKNTNAIQTQYQGEAEKLIAQAIDKNVSVESLERLLAMRRELKAEYAKAEFDKYMANFQSQCPPIVKDKIVKTNSGAIAYKFAPIDSIIKQAKPYIKKNGFSYKSDMEIIENGSTKIKVVIKVTHAAGHSELTEMTVPLGTKTNIMSDTQVVAAAQTFAKRYAFCNAFGILTSDEDNDAVLKNAKKDVPALPEDAIKRINEIESFQGLVAICKVLKIELGTTYQSQLVEEYTRRKKELEKEIADTVTEGEHGE